MTEGGSARSSTDDRCPNEDASCSESHRSRTSERKSDPTGLCLGSGVATLFREFFATNVENSRKAGVRSANQVKRAASLHRLALIESSEPLIKARRARDGPGPSSTVGLASRSGRVVGLHLSAPRNTAPLCGPLIAAKSSAARGRSMVPPFPLLQRSLGRSKQRASSLEDHVDPVVRGIVATRRETDGATVCIEAVTAS
jgi:hypothetical protein